MLEKIRLDRFDHTDLNMYQCGIEDCAPGHTWGPAVRDHFLIHYIIEGKGVFQVNNISYSLEKGQGFLIYPGIISYYKADEYSPWSYSWVGFHGLKAQFYLKRAGLSPEKPIFTYSKDEFLKECLSQMITTSKLSKSSDVQLLSLLYSFLASMIENACTGNPDAENESRRELYIKKAVEFIEASYSTKISVAGLARYLGLDRSYFCTIFKNNLNKSPQEFIINFRINKACDLMQNKSLSIGDISRSVGYEDQLLFSKAFKKLKGVSPKEYRNAFV